MIAREKPSCHTICTIGHMSKDSARSFPKRGLIRSMGGHARNHVRKSDRCAGDEARYPMRVQAGSHWTHVN